jgi:acyl-CoA reductase-like NAD-dependent aldehyde dehydrogenase
VQGKCLNAGQVCLAPDYLLVHKKVVDQLTDRLISTARAFYGESMKDSTSLSRIINARHFQRVSKLLDTSGGKVVFGGNKDAATNYIDLTFIRDPSLTAPVMQEEIFGTFCAWTVALLRLVDVNGHCRPAVTHRISG